MTPAEYYHQCLTSIAPVFDSHWKSIANAYSGRAYHNLGHLAEILGHFAALPTDIAPAAPPVFGVGLIYHDLVYVAGRKNNEARSADMATAALKELGANTANIKYCHNLIMATKNHEAATADEALLVDMDLAVLARSAEGYDAYARAVRQEFRYFPGLIYRPGRKQALRHFLDKPRIYQTEHFYHRFEAMARANLEREIATL